VTPETLPTFRHYRTPAVTTALRADEALTIGSAAGSWPIVDPVEILQEATEAEVVLAFLQGEMDKEGLRQWMNCRGIDDRLIREGDPLDPAENKLRRELLGGRRPPPPTRCPSSSGSRRAMTNPTSRTEVPVAGSHVSVRCGSCFGDSRHRHSHGFGR
jgi:hypothetical protein